MKTTTLASIFAAFALTFTLAGAAKADGETATPAPAPATPPTTDSGRSELDARVDAAATAKLIGDTVDRLALDERQANGERAAASAALREQQAEAARLQQIRSTP
jgi:hypothetical protein